MYDPSVAPSPAPAPESSRPRPPVASRALAVALPSTGGTDPARLGVLAAVLYNPIVLVGYLLYLYGPSAHCVAGPLCQFGTYPGAIQIVLMLLGIWLLWLLLVVVVRRILEAPGWQGRLTRWLRALSEYESVKELLGVYAVAMMVALLISFMAHVLTPATLILGGFTVAVSLRASLLRDLPRGIFGDHVVTPAGYRAPAPALPSASAPFAAAPYDAAPYDAAPYDAAPYDAAPYGGVPSGPAYGQPYAPSYSQPYDQPTAYSPPAFSRPTDPPASYPLGDERQAPASEPVSDYGSRPAPDPRPEQGSDL